MCPLTKFSTSRPIYLVASDLKFRNCDGLPYPLLWVFRPRVRRVSSVGRLRGFVVNLITFRDFVPVSFADIHGARLVFGSHGLVCGQFDGLYLSNSRGGSSENSWAIRSWGLVSTCNISYLNRNVKIHPSRMSLPRQNSFLFPLSCNLKLFIWRWWIFFVPLTALVVPKLNTFSLLTCS